MRFSLRKYAESVFTLFYPRLCMVCDSGLVGNEALICTPCRHSMPLTRFHLAEGNPVEQLYWGRLPVDHATSLFFFDRGSRYNRLVHDLKYHGRKDAGLFLGRMLGAAIQEGLFSAVDFIIPVPLHKAKLRRRGYNQSDIIARGVGEVLKVDVLPGVLERKIYTQTQTRRKRYERWMNVEGIFKCGQNESIQGKHILLVDDVITTGATMEAAGRALCETANVRLSIASVSYTNY